MGLTLGDVYEHEKEKPSGGLQSGKVYKQEIERFEWSYSEEVKQTRKRKPRRGLHLRTYINKKNQKRGGCTLGNV